MNDAPILISKVMTRRLGPVWLGLSSRGLVAVEFGVSRGRFAALVRNLTGAEVVDRPRQHLQVARQLKEYLRGQRRSFKLAIDWSFMSSDFQRATLQAVRAIPYGQTRTYAQIAAQIGHPNASRAVGRANARNPMPLVIPCHRVVGSDGKLHGYGGRGGLSTKAWLLKMEGAGWGVPR